MTHHRLAKLSFSLLLLTGIASLTACSSSHDPYDYRRDDYFGGQGNLIPDEFVPRQVQRP